MRLQLGCGRFSFRKFSQLQTFPTARKFARIEETKGAQIIQ